MAYGILKIDVAGIAKCISFKHMLVQVKFIFYFHDK